MHEHRPQPPLPRLRAAATAAGALALLLALSAPLSAEQRFPKPDWQDAPNPLADPLAQPGGELSAFAGQYPESFNYYLANNSFCAELFSALYESLLDMNPLSAEYEPGLAASWTISDDQRAFTFTLDPRARWSDGRPVTAADVCWTFQAIVNPTNLTGVHKVAFEKFLPPEALASNVVRFTTTEVHWRNLGACGGFSILPAHAYAGRDFNKLNFEFPVVSGPYRLAEIQEGVSAKLRRRPDWWRRGQPRVQGLANFDTLTFRFFAEQENAFEAFKKGLIDVFPVYMSRIWVNETRGEKFEKHWIVKQRVQNHRPIGFQGFAMNLRRPPFDDRRVRLALAHLLDRDKMNRTLMYGQYFLHRSYFEDLYSKDQPCPNPSIAFDKDRARQLLREAGWTANPQTGWLEKDGRRFSFTFLNRDQSSEKFLAIYAEDLKDVGIAMKIEVKDWAAWARDMEEFNFDMTWAAWSAGLFKDPEDMWASREADRRGGNNITGFRDPRVDELIERQRTLFDVNARHAICREIDALVAAQCPYILLWNIDAVRLLYWNKFGTPPTVLGKYGGESAAYTYWWYDEDAAAELRDAMQNGLPLPPKKPVVSFDEEFGKR